VPRWIRNLALIVGLSGWGATIASYLAQGQLPDALTLGVPAGLILALAPPIKSKKKATAASDENDGDATENG
jgi:hypothetical protein